ncbi:MAG: helix-turn-helix transcriptional regulator, partial [Thermoplasmata archaeon]|nr:helix-turn-helix transcriptional regulator [Thermoplasmata archaeon]
IPEDGDFRMNNIQSNIVDFIDENPGISQKEIAQAMNVTPPTVNYHIGILASAKMIRVVREGRRTNCFIDRS